MTILNKNHLRLLLFGLTTLMIGISVICYFWTGFKSQGIVSAVFWMGFFFVVFGVGISGPTYKSYLNKDGTFDRTQAFQGLGKQEMPSRGSYSDLNIKEDRDRFKQGVIVIVFGMVLIIISSLVSQVN